MPQLYRDFFKTEFLQSHSIDNEEATVLRSQSPCGELNDREQETEEQNKQMAKENKEETNQRTKDKERISRNDTKISRTIEVRA